jgi:hypothetical protein
MTGERITICRLLYGVLEDKFEGETMHCVSNTGCGREYTTKQVVDRFEKYQEGLGAKVLFYLLREQK